MGFIVRALCLLSLGLIYFFQCFGRATILNVFIFICGLQLGVNESSAEWNCGSATLCSIGCHAPLILNSHSQAGNPMFCWFN
jgi:hypothetical protein